MMEDEKGEERGIKGEQEEGVKERRGQWERVQLLSWPIHVMPANPAG